MRVAVVLLAAAASAHAQTTWLDATSGSNTISTNFTTTGTGGLTLNMGFYVDYLVVGGGGGGGGAVYFDSGKGGGGGAGGQVVSNVGQTLLNAPSTLSVTIGAGGTAGSWSAGSPGGAGGTSSIAGAGITTISALGGGAGGGYNYNGTNGGGNANIGGTGGRGTNAASGRTGGSGVSTTITGSNALYAGGGSAGGNSSSTGSVAGTNGGGTGSAYGGGNVTPSQKGGDAAANTGGGGGGGGGTTVTDYWGGAGGSGLVMIRYAGGSTGISGGTSITGTGSALGYTIQRFNSSSTFSVDLAARLAATLTGTVSGTGNVTYGGPGRLVLATDNSYLGTTTISGGTLQVGSGGTVGTLGAGGITNNATLVFNRSDLLTVASGISGTGSLIQQGSGATVLTGSNSYSGTTTITAGTLQVGTGGTDGTLGGSGSIANAGVLAFNRSDAVTLSRVVSGTGALMQQGPGTMVLAAANNYSGATTITAGTLQVGSGGTAGTLGTGDVAVAANATLVFDRSDDVGISNVILGDGSLVKNGAGDLTLFRNNAYTGGTRVNAGTLIASANSALGTGTVTLAGGGLQVANGVVISNEIVLDGTPAASVFGALLPVEYLAVGGGGGGGGTRWETASGGGAANGGGGGAGGEVASNYGGTALAIESPLTVTVGGGGSGGALSIGTSGGASSISGTGVTTVTALGGGAGGGGGYAGVDGGGSSNLGGDGNRTANANAGRTGGAGVSNSITGSTVFYGGGGSAGGNSTSTGTAAGTNGGGTGAAYGGGNASPTQAGGSGTANVGGGGGGAGGTTVTYYSGGSGGSGVVVLRYTGAPAATGGVIDVASVPGSTLHHFTVAGSTNTFAISTSGTATLQGRLTGTGGFTWSAPSTLLITGSNSYQGDTVISAGTLRVGDGGTTGSLGGGSVTNNAALVINRSDAFTVSSVISGSGSLTKQGAGGLTLLGDNTYTGALAIESGTLQVGNGGTAGVLGGSGAIANAGTLVFNRGDAVTVARAINGVGGVVQQGAGTTILSGNNSYAGATTIASGTLQVGSGGTAGTLGVGSVAVASGATLAFDRGDDLSVPNAISGGGAVVKNGGGNLSLFNENSYSGGTLITSGTVVLGSGQALGTGLVTLAGGKLQMTNGASITNDIVLAGGAADTVLTAALPVEMLVVGGGGGGGGTRWEVDQGGGPNVAGGGGAGGQVVAGASSLAAGASLTVTVGGGGSGGSSIIGSAGGSSSITGSGFATLTALGGGAAGGGGYSGINGGGNANVGGTGGRSLNAVSGQTGGAGVASTITGSTVLYGGGGGAGGNSLASSGAAGVDGGGAGANYGGGATSPTQSGSAGLANTGGGGGGAGATTVTYYNGGAGGSGVVFIRYFGTPVATGGTIDTTSAPGYTLHRFTNTGASSFALTSLATTTTLQGSLSGTGGFTWNAPSTLVLTGSNSYSGVTTVSSGTLQVGNGVGSGSLGTGHVTNNGSLIVNRTGSLAVPGSIAGTGAVTKLGSGDLTLSGSNTYSGGTTISAGSLIGTTASLQGPIANAAAVVFDDASGGAYAGAISGTGSLEKRGAGTVTFSGANSYSGGTIVSAGTLATSAANRLSASTAASIAAGATLSLGGDQTLAVVTGSGSLDLAAGTLTVGATTGEFAGSITGTGSLVKSGVGSFTLSGSNTFSGDLTVSGGTLLLDNDFALTAATDVSLTSGATLSVAAGRVVRVNSFMLTQGTLGGAGALEAGTTTVDSATIDTPIEDAPGQSSNFVKTGTGTTTVNAANTFTGTVDVQAGTVQLGPGGSFSPASSLQLVAGAALDLAGNSQTFAGISGTAGSIALGAGTLTVSTTAPSTFGGVITGSGGLVKSAAGNLILAGTSTYTGATSVSAGRLSVNGALGNTAVTVQSGGELGGAGSILGPVALLAGATLAPGNSIASFATGTASFAAAATFGYEVDSSLLGSLGTAADLLVVSGNLDIASGALLSFADITSGTVQPFVEDTTIFAMINYSGAWNGGLFTYGGSPLADGSRFSVGSQLWEIDYDSPTGGDNFTGDYLPSSSFVTVTAVPEPSTLVLLGIGGVLACWVARRRAGQAIL